jgi:hypothetical protein
MVIVDIASDQPDVSVAADRLMKNQVDIGNAVKPYYGVTMGNKLTALLQAHIQIANDILVASKAKDSAKVEDAKARWYANADEIAVFLHNANPKNWSLADAKALMRTHLDTTLDEAGARFQGNWRADVAAFDKVQNHILMMADVISLGIIRQFPEKFAVAKKAGLAQRLHLRMFSKANAVN